LPGQYTISSCPLPSAYAGEPYAQQLAAAGGTEPYIFGEASPLPSGLRVSPAGILTGQIAVPGTYPVNLRVADASGRVTTRSCGLTVLPQALRTTTACPLPSGTVGQSYSYQVGAAGGIAPYAFSVLGQLSAGLQISDQGVISGTPTDMGFYALGIS